MPNPRAAAAPQPDVPTASTDLSAVDALLRVQIELDEAGGLTGFATSLAETLTRLTGADGCRITADQGDGRGAHRLAATGRPGSARSLYQRVPVSRPWSAELLLSAADEPGNRTLALLAAQRLGMALEHLRLRDTDVRHRTWLTFLSEASELLAQSLDLSLTLALIPRLVVPRLGTWCTLHRVSGKRLEPAAAAHADEERSDWLEAAAAELTHLLQAPAVNATIRAGQHVPLPSPLAGLAVPLFARGQWLGVLGIGRDPDATRDPDETTIAEELARRCALALDNAAIHAERQAVAHTLQQALLPTRLPVIPGLGLGAEYVPAGRGAEVGGDLYDIMPMPDGRWLVVMGDVSGKGVPAAAATGLVREVLRLLVREGRPLESVLATLNTTLSERSERYCTLALAAFDVPDRDGAVPVTLYLAGHDRPLLLHADGAVEQTGDWGTALGLISPVTCQPTLLMLRPGETLVFFTDGVTERRSGTEFFGARRLAQRLTYLAGHPADVIATRLRTAALEFSGEPARDDMAIMAIRNDAV
ncbi:SpoIIE family protein phosphatase [Catellatospora sp. KI3]|uniref:PP2C family protein-serine/threonine phosphatase n=1 Tax=Catellatospora sp. KI3 TaxID=3041620 RepID=UPI0024823BAA|nr:SpoIIE family protein phosphatase [Catellatospora sp. KI3]MDI1462676.1 SpoIIE family protein phosphatase [Catellatospora sp. KI3]